MAQSGRTTVYNKITTPELIEQINPENKSLVNDFLSYCKGILSQSSISKYKSDLQIFFVYVLQHLNNKSFVDISKREFAQFQNYCIEDWGWSSNRIRTVKAAISSLSNYIENILDDEYENYRSSVRKIKSPVKAPVREKSVFTIEEITKVAEELLAEGKIQLACILMVCAASGRRREELPRLKASYFSDENIVYGSLYKTPEKVRTKGHGTTGKLLPLYIVVKTCKKYVDLWMERRRELGIDCEYMFVTKQGDKWQKAEISTMDSWKSIINKHTSQPFYWHALRHMFVTEFKRVGLPDSVIQKMVGWETADMVGIYNDMDTDEELGSYFGEDGVKTKSVKLSDL